MTCVFRECLFSREALNWFCCCEKSRRSCRGHSLLRCHQLFLDIFLVLSYFQDTCSDFFFFFLTPFRLSVVQRKSIHVIFGCICNKSSETFRQISCWLRSCDFLQIVVFGDAQVCIWIQFYTPICICTFISHPYFSVNGFCRNNKTSLKVTTNQNTLMLLSCRQEVISLVKIRLEMWF